jgi:hypothetical protein
MTLEKQIVFAARVGVDRSQVTRWKRKGRLVLEGDLVNVEASLQRIEATRGTRHDVTARHDAERGQSLAFALPEPADRPAVDPAPADVAADPQPGMDLDAIGRRTRIAQMEKEEHVAALKRLERAQREGQLIDKGEVAGAATDAVAVILSAAEAIPDRLAPLLIGADVERARAILRDEVETLLSTVSHQMGRLAG